MCPSLMKRTEPLTARDDPRFRDFWRLMTDEPELGSGQYRIVYGLRHLPDLVVKVEKEEGCFHNIREWDTWQTVQYQKTRAQWLAPCVAISPCGLFLLQKRTTPVTLKELPEKVPAFLTDRKVGNFGRIDRRIVCHDYAFTIVDLSVRMVKAKWWRE